MSFLRYLYISAITGYDVFFFSSRRRHTRSDRDWSSDVCSSDLELRTPLTSISGFLEMMEDEEHGIGDTGRTYLEVIRRSTDRLHGLVEDLLLIAQIEAS